MKQLLKKLKQENIYIYNCLIEDIEISLMLENSVEKKKWKTT